MNINELASSFPTPKEGDEAAWWDKRTLHWELMREQNVPARERDDRRILETTAFLRREGLINPTATVLDLGCGPGRYACAIAKQCKQVTGIDISPAAIRIAEQEAAIQNIKKASFRQLAYRQVPKLAHSYDLLFAMFSTAFFDLDFLSSVKAVTPKAGCLCLYIHRYDEIKNDLSLSLFNQPAQQYRDTEAFSSLFSILLQLGYKARVDYQEEEYTESRKLTQDYAADLAQILWTKTAPPANAEQQVFDLLKERAQDGSVCGKVRGTIGRLWWFY